MVQQISEIQKIRRVGNCLPCHHQEERFFQDFKSWRSNLPEDHLPSEKQNLQKFKRLVLVEFRMLFAEQFFLHFSHAVSGEFRNMQDSFGKFERCELRAQLLQDEFFTESIMI